MEEQLYQMIFKRKSFHLFKDIGKISAEELQDIEAAFQTCKPLAEDIRVDMKIVPAEKTSCKRGEEYCILLYSQQKAHFLQNIGYLGEQLDLYLASRNIGALWFGIGKTEEKSDNGLDFVIMIAIAKMEASESPLMRFGPENSILTLPKSPDSLPVPAIPSRGSWRVGKRSFRSTGTRNPANGVSCRLTG